MWCTSTPRTSGEAARARCCWRHREWPRGAIPSPWPARLAERWRPRHGPSGSRSGDCPSAVIWLPARSSGWPASWRRGPSHRSHPRSPRDQRRAAGRPTARWVPPGGESPRLAPPARPAVAQEVCGLRPGDRGEPRRGPGPARARPSARRVLLVHDGVPDRPPARDGREALRELGISDDCPVIGNVAALTDAQRPRDPARSHAPRAGGRAVCAPRHRGRRKAARAAGGGGPEAGTRGALRVHGLSNRHRPADPRLLAPVPDLADRGARIEPARRDVLRTPGRGHGHRRHPRGGRAWRDRPAGAGRRSGGAGGGSERVAPGDGSPARRWAGRVGFASSGTSRRSGWSTRPCACTTSWNRPRPIGRHGGASAAV